VTLAVLFFWAGVNSLRILNKQLVSYLGSPLDGPNFLANYMAVCHEEVVSEFSRAFGVGVGCVIVIWEGSESKPRILTSMTYSLNTILGRDVSRTCVFVDELRNIKVKDWSGGLIIEFRGLFFLAALSGF